MSWIRVAVVASAFLAGIWIGPGITRADQSPKLILVTEEWPPYNYQAGGAVTGFSADIVRAVMADLGEAHDIQIYPGARGHAMLDHLPNVMNFSLFRTPEREDKYKWVGPLSIERVYFYKHGEDGRIYQDLDDIRAAGLVISPHRGLIAEQLQALGLENVEQVVDQERQIERLINRRADLMVGLAPLGMSHYLHRMGEEVTALRRTRVKLVEYPLYIACSRMMPDQVVARWQGALDRVRRSGEYDRIHQRYLAPGSEN